MDYVDEALSLTISCLSGKLAETPPLTVSNYPDSMTGASVVLLARRVRLHRVVSPLSRSLLQPLQSRPRIYEFYRNFSHLTAAEVSP